MPDKRRWVKLAESLEELQFNENGLAEADADGKIICLARTEEGLFAVAAKCPHAGGRFADGFVDAKGDLVCPLHRYRFCLRNGRNVSGEGYYVKHWPIEQRADGVYVGLENRAFFGLV